MTCLRFAIALCALMPTSVGAANMRFAGNISEPNACVILIDSNGTLAQNSSGSVLSSRLTGGTSGIARVLSFRNYSISVVPRSHWVSSPIDGDQDTDFSPSFSGTSILGGVNFARRPGDATLQLPFRLTFTRMRIDLEATHQSGSFPSGAYQGEVTLRCE